jgi:hypothetical protein
MDCSLSYLIDGNDSNKLEGLLENFSDGFTQDDTWLHMLVTNYTVFFVVLLYFHADVIDKACQFVES